jgi:cobalt-zinc-cadmium resistance protein CzcA
MRLSEFAEIEYAAGPAKISRENAHRRGVVSVNVRNRDLQSVVTDIRAKIDQNVKLNPSTYITYGGQFENLQNASKRLLFAVPVALLLIFIFLHFAFKSLKDAVMIFSAIPLATVGGVFFLWLRGMPFSISAGVGFIALFGIAVLNGIVLIEHLKELKEHGNLSMRELIIQGTKNRLRPVMLTAGAAAMGFLPMAISTGAGAEVQRPLATVVIGGLFTSTMLTMIALPLLFEIFSNVTGVKFFPFRLIRMRETLTLLLLLLPFTFTLAQKPEINLDQVVDITLRHNKEIKACNLKTEAQKTLISSAVDIDKTQVSYGTDQNILLKIIIRSCLECGAAFRLSHTLWSRLKAKKIEYDLAENRAAIEIQRIIKNVSLNFVEIQLLNEKLVVLSVS